MNRNRGILMLLGASVLWSFAGICVKSMSWNGFAITGIRGLIAAAMMLVIIRKPRIPRGKYQILAVCSYTGLICMTVIATKMTTAANAILLQYTSPVYSAALGYCILGEKVSRRDRISIVMIFAGLFIFFYDGLAGGHLLGDLVALLSGVCFAAMNVFMRADSRVSPLQNVFWGNLAAFVFMLPFFGHVEWSMKNTGLVLFLGIFQLGLAYILYSKAILYVGALEATVTTVLEAILNPIWVMILGNEKIDPATLAGGLIVLAAVVIRSVPVERYVKTEKVKE
ncbi:MAG: DMT family transporter [Ruminococcus sp.]